MTGIHANAVVVTTVIQLTALNCILARIKALLGGSINFEQRQLDDLQTGPVMSAYSAYIHLWFLGVSLCLELIRESLR